MGGTRAAPAAGGFSLSGAIHRVAAASRPIRAPGTAGSTCIFPPAAYSHPRRLLAAPYPVPGASPQPRTACSAAMPPQTTAPDSALRCWVECSVAVGRAAGLKMPKVQAPAALFQWLSAIPTVQCRAIRVCREAVIKATQGAQISIHCSGYLPPLSCIVPSPWPRRNMYSPPHGYLQLRYPCTAKNRCSTGGSSAGAPATEVPVRGLYSALFSLQHPGRILRDPVNMPTQCLAYAYVC